MSRLKSSLKNMLKIFSKKGLQSEIDYVMIVRAVTLIAMKREVAARVAQVFRGANVKFEN